MYDQLLYCGDLNFALNVAELLYTKVITNFLGPLDGLDNLLFIIEKNKSLLSIKFIKVAYRTTIGKRDRGISNIMIEGYMHRWAALGGRIIPKEIFHF